MLLCLWPMLWSDTWSSWSHFLLAFFCDMNSAVISTWFATSFTSELMANPLIVGLIISFQHCSLQHPKFHFELEVLITLINYNQDFNPYKRQGYASKRVDIFMSSLSIRLILSVKLSWRSTFNEPWMLGIWAENGFILSTLSLQYVCDKECKELSMFPVNNFPPQ